MKTSLMAGAAALMFVNAGAHAQVIFNEIFENPPGSVDNRWEYIELYGKPGTSLTGYAIALLKGGDGTAPNGLPVPGLAETFPEIDEAFSLDGYSIGPNGLFVLYNNTAGLSFITQFLAQNPGYNPGLPDGPLNQRFIGAAGYVQTHIPSTDTPGNLSNDNSSTYVLARKRPNHVIGMNGFSQYLSGYAWRKDVNQDVNFDSFVDFGMESPIPGAGQARVMEPYQMVDEVSWSNNSGREYQRSREQKLSDTPGFNPDALSRVAFYGRNPARGHRVNSEGEIVVTWSADEEWVYGEIVSVPGLMYDNSIDDEGLIQVKGPTDPNGPLYNDDLQQDPNGMYLFDDINLNGFKMTPNAFNDADGTPMGGINIVQFRFVAGDFNFDQSADLEDLYLVNERLGATLDDTEQRVFDNGTPDNPADDIVYTAWKWEGRAFQGLLVMMDMAPTDGMGGVNSPEVTASDALASRDMVRAGELSDIN